MTYQRMKHARRRRGMHGFGDDEESDSSLDEFFAMIGLGSQKPAPTDNVNQTATGTSTTAADFTAVSGVCKPQNFPALDAARELQNQLNRVAQVKGMGKVAVDGAIGPGTLALFRKVQSLSSGQVMGDPSNCMGVAPDVDVLSVQVKGLADSMGAPATVSGAIHLAPTTIVTKSGKQVVAPDTGVLSSVAAMSSIEKVALLGVAGAIGYLVMNRRRRQKRGR